MKNIIRILILVFIFALSFYLRLDAYLINNSFFTDEVLLFSNIYNRNFIELILPLNFFQSAPYLFLVMSKLISNFVGMNELCLRFLPMIFSLTSVILFYKLCKQVFKTELALYSALFIFGINYQLIYYSQTFKQYSSDVLITVLLLYIAFKYWNKTETIKHFTILGLLSLLSVFASFPSIFIIPSIYLAFLIFKSDKMQYILYSSIYPLSGLLIYYIFNFRYVGNNEYLKTYWMQGFQIFSSEIYNKNFDYLFQYFSFPLILVILLLTGMYFLYKNNKYQFSVLLFTFCFIFIAAFLKIYPIERRLILYVIPILIIAALYPVDNIRKNFVSYATIILSFLFFGSGSYGFFKEYSKRNVSYLKQDVKPLLEIIENKSSDEKVYVYYGAISGYSYYSLIKNLPKDVIFATYPKDEKLSEIYLIDDLKKLPEGIYYLFFIKGTWTYDKDMEELDSYLKKSDIISDKTLKSTRLIKVNIK